MTAIARRLLKLEQSNGTELSRLSDDDLEARLRDLDTRIREAGRHLTFTLPADFSTATDQWWRETLASLGEQPL